MWILLVIKYLCTTFTHTEWCVSMLEQHLQWHYLVKCFFECRYLFYLHSTVMLYNLLLLCQQYFHYWHYTVSHLFCDNSAPDPTSPRPLWAQERFFDTIEWTYEWKHTQHKHITTATHTRPITHSSNPNNTPTTHNTTIPNNNALTENHKHQPNKQQQS